MNVISLSIPKQVEKLVSDSSESSRDSASEIDPILQYGIDFGRSNPKALAKPESQLFNLFGYKVFCVYFLLILLTGCHPRGTLLEPKICYQVDPHTLQSLPSAFPLLTSEELTSDWGKEIKIGYALAKEGDLYRAITSYKRALILMPQNLQQEQQGRKQQAEFAILQCYWLGGREGDAIAFFEQSSLPHVSNSFPPFREMMVILYSIYRENDQKEKAEMLLALIEKGAPETAAELKLYQSLDEGNLCHAQEAAALLKTEDGLNTSVKHFSQLYCQCAKSVRTAQTLNALLPGAGYYYVGQKQSALTSFLINLTFTSAAYSFFKDRYWAAGAIAASLECGWYFGGINGAGLAAKHYNQRLYEEMGKELMVKRRLFPVLMLETSF